MRCFVVHSNKIEERIDPFYYQPDFVKQSESLGSNTKAIREIAKVICGPFGSSITVKDYSNNGIPLIRICNIKDGELNTENIVFITKELANKLKSYAVKEGDLIISQRGTLGLVAKIPLAFNNAVIGANFIAIKDLTKISPEFLQFYLSSIQGHLQIIRRTSGQVQTKITTDDIKSIKVPILESQSQNRIVSIMQSAYIQKKQKKQEAQQLLDSINNYVLDELGIKLPELKDKMCFTVNSEEIKSKRIDPKGYSEIPRGILKVIKKAKYSQKPLSSLVEKSISGEWGEDIEGAKDNENYVLVKVLRNTNFYNQGNLDFSKVAQRMIDKEKFEKVRLKNGDILVEKSGGSPVQPVGRVAIIDDVKTDFAFSNFLQVIRVKKQECLPEYLFCFLKALYSLNYMEYIQNQTTGIKNLIMEEFLSIPVSLPSINKQREIAREYKNKWKAAEQLQEEAINVLKEAKEKVERIILEE
jgi:restriction endonuclease S subunit